MTAPASDARTRHPLVVQHNALVNGRFDLNTTETRLFLAMLAQIQRDDTSFGKCELRVQELLDSTSSQNYGHIRKVLETFASRLVTLETLGPDGQRILTQRTYSAIPLLARADYVEGEGLLVLRFNDELQDYLLQLHSHFTKAQLVELMKLKSAVSSRIYWLLREYATFGKRTIALEELKAILGLSQGYDRFNNFRARVLERAKAELAHTDLPFTYVTRSKGRTVTHIEFHFKPVGPASPPPSLPGAPVAEWEAAVRAAGVSARSIPHIQEQVAVGTYDAGYISYVLNTVKAQVTAGKVKNEGGAVFKALTAGYLLEDYEKAQQAARTKRTTNPATERQRRKLTSELEDTRNSLAFVQTADCYDEETRPGQVAVIVAKLADLEAQLRQLSP
ncbi:replication initiation protein [Hymenobacter algoricola]|uniref:Initiator Rep protein WH1 domain-containing protein n=1 Tax=Hymenobacter algoricola TaxID=486267 RepID=A0ABP7MZU7_9BACT